MLKLILAVVVVATLSGCGWSHKCVNSRSYALGAQQSVAVGSPMLQSGCFAAQYESRGLRNLLFGMTSYPDEGFEARVKQELLYSGRNGDIIHVTYREYTGDGLARSSFFQQLTYDIAASKTIVFQGWTLNVVDADNQHIELKVVKEPERPEPFYM